jgi:sugar phosphate isomerase/epimerase
VELNKKAWKSMNRLRPIHPSGVALLLVPINRYETNLVNSAQDGLKMLDEVESPNLKLLLDTVHCQMMNLQQNWPASISST